MTGRIFDQLVARYGKASVFMDIDDIPPGMDFRAHIKEVLFRSDVLIVVIGNKWTGPQENRPARIFERKDPIRVEVLTALNRDMMVVPVLVDGAKMPEEKHIPRAIKNLAYLNAITIDAGKDFHPHIDRLIRAVDRSTSSEGQSARGIGSDAGVSEATPAPNDTFILKLAPTEGRVVFLRFLLLPAFLLILTNYLFLHKLDLDPFYLRLVCVLVPLGFGFNLSWYAVRGLGYATLIGAGVGAISVVGMAVINTVLDPRFSAFDLYAILPSSTREWQEVVSTLPPS